MYNAGTKHKIRLHPFRPILCPAQQRRVPMISPADIRLQLMKVLYSDSFC